MEPASASRCLEPRRGRNVVDLGSARLLDLTIASPPFMFPIFSLSPWYHTTRISRSFSLFLEQKFDPMGQQTCSAHPARFSPDDKYSRHRITIKKRFKVLMTQQPRPVLWEFVNFICCPAPGQLSATKCINPWAGTPSRTVWSPISPRDWVYRHGHLPWKEQY